MTYFTPEPQSEPSTVFWCYIEIVKIRRYKQPGTNNDLFYPKTHHLLIVVVAKKRLECIKYKPPPLPNYDLTVVHLVLDESDTKRTLVNICFINKHLILGKIRPNNQ